MFATQAMQRGRGGAAVLVFLGLVTLAGFRLSAPTHAEPDDATTYVVATERELMLWTMGADGPDVTRYELGLADPDVGTGWRAVQDAPTGPYLFRTASRGAPERLLEGRIVAVSGVVWDAAASLFLSGSPASGLTVWRVVDGQVVEVVRHDCTYIPARLQVTERRTPAGRVERNTILGEPRRPLATTTRIPPAPEGRVPASTR